MASKESEKKGEGDGPPPHPPVPWYRQLLAMKDTLIIVLTPFIFLPIPFLYPTAVSLRMHSSLQSFCMSCRFHFSAVYFAFFRSLCVCNMLGATVSWVNWEGLQKADLRMWQQVKDGCQIGDQNYYHQFGELRWKNQKLLKAVWRAGSAAN